MFEEKSAWSDQTFYNERFIKTCERSGARVKTERRTGERSTSAACLTAVKREKFAKNKKNTSKERLSLLLFKV